MSQGLGETLLLIESRTIVAQTGARSQASVLPSVSSKLRPAMLGERSSTSMEGSTTVCAGAPELRLGEGGHYGEWSAELYVYTALAPQTI